MVHYLVKIIFLLFIIMPNNIHSCLIQGINREVHILNSLPGNTPQLEFHCASGDDELGYHYPAIGSDFNWQFCATSNTLFFCHFWWGDKDSSFDVFNRIESCVWWDGVDFVPVDAVKCLWKVQDDGFYLGYFDEKANKNFYKKYRNW
ncbi:hypothetical protein A4A49_20453 [Nicotiana attenuata]|uniref:S-protein homolog n=1 Tax=Nicotiana attenuata TaxID=49451 RepID=A0A1J6KD01_NICAT|nr:hypothetical protein A4A49_20453 [Nicotiana attenuata]